MKPLTSAIILVVGLLAIGYGVWMWGFCRFYVNFDEMAVIIAKEGDDGPAGQILAKPGQKGIQEGVLGEGRYFYNPWMYEHEILKVLTIDEKTIGIVTSKVGKALPEGEFLAEAGEKGVWRRVLGPGKYRMNPYGYDVEIVPATSVPIGFVGVVTSLSGERAPDGQFARGNQKGIRSEVLQPGLYYANPKQYQIDVLEIGVNQVSLLGKKGSAVITKGLIETSNSAFNEMNATAVQEQQAKRADYVNQRGGMEQTIVNDDDSSSRGRSNSASGRRPRQGQNEQDLQANPPPGGMPQSMAGFTLSQFVEFPSRDGFLISLDMTVEFELLPGEIAKIYRDYGDLPVVLDNIIMPQILSISRLKGSAYRATDFIVGEGREMFQNELTESLRATLKDKRVVVHNALIRHVSVPQQILAPIQQSSMAREQDLTNKERQNTARKQAELNTEQSLIDQNRDTVAQETTKMQAEIKADTDKQVAMVLGETLKQVADIDQQIAGIRAAQTRLMGQAMADQVRLVDGEKAKGFELKVGVFKEASAYSAYEFARALNPSINLNIFHSGPGTLWTDLDKARLGELGGAKLLRDSGK